MDLWWTCDWVLFPPLLFLHPKLLNSSSRPMMLSLPVDHLTKLQSTSLGGRGTWVLLNTVLIVATLVRYARWNCVRWFNKYFCYNNRVGTFEAAKESKGDEETPKGTGISAPNLGTSFVILLFFTQRLVMLYLSWFLFLILFSLVRSCHFPCGP